MRVPQELRLKFNSDQFAEVAGIWRVDDSIQISKVLHNEVLQATMTMIHKYGNVLLKFNALA